MAHRADRARQRGWRRPAWAGPGVQGQGGMCLFADNGFLCPFLAVASAKMARESVYKCVLAEHCSVPGVRSSPG